MKRFLKYVKDSLLTLFILALSFILSILLHELCNTPSLAPLFICPGSFYSIADDKGLYLRYSSVYAKRSCC